MHDALEDMYDNYYNDAAFDKCIKTACRLIKKGADINMKNHQGENLGQVIAQKFVDFSRCDFNIMHSIEYKYKQLAKYGKTLAFLICNGIDFECDKKQGVSIESYINQAAPGEHRNGLVHLMSQVKNFKSKEKDASK